MINRIFVLFCSMLLLCESASASSVFDLTVEVDDFRNTKGELIVSLFDEKRDWLNEHKIFKKQTIPVSSPVTSITFKGLPSGNYAVSILHDENADGKMETRFFGIPAEGLAISNDAPFHFGPPRFKEAQFVVTENMTIQCSMSYFSLAGKQ